MSDPRKKAEKQLKAIVDNYKRNDADIPIIVNDTTHNDREHRNIMEKEPRRIREDPVAFMLNIGLHYNGTGWRGYNNYIGTKILYPGFGERMRTMVLNSENVQSMIDTLAERQAQHLEEVQKTEKNMNLSETERQKRINRQKKALRRELEVVAKGVLQKCVSTLDSLKTVKMFAFIVKNVLARLYHQGIHIKESEWVELKRVALIAQQKKQSLILLPCHKSHIDYLVVSYVFFRLGMQIPHVIAGDNLDLPVLGNLLKSSGGIYIKREWGDDPLYKTIMDEYIATLLAEGMNFECFVEGTRSRLGKLLAPKLGIIKIILDALVNNRFSDCYIVPISIGYDKIIETSSYANELLGQPKEKESIWGLLTSSSILQFKWGRVDVRVGNAYSMRGWLEDQLRMRGQLDLTKAEHKSILLKSFGYRVLSDINSISVVMPSALVGTAILTSRGRGVGRSELIRRVDWLTRVITDKGGQVAEFHGMSTGTVVDRTVSIHSDLIGEHKDKDILEPTFYGIKSFELSYYRNQVIHLFVEEAIACVALYTAVKRGSNKKDQRMQYAELLEEVSFLSSLLKLDMIYKPGGIENNTKRTVQWLANNNVISVSEDGWIGLSEEEIASGRENYDFLCFLLWPFIESYWLAAFSLYSLAPSSKSPQKGSIWVEKKLYAARMQALGKTLYHQGGLSYMESVNKETLGNALERFQQQNILTIRRHNTPKIWAEVALNEAYLPERVNGILAPRGPLWDLVQHIGTFRMEGKNRRDSATESAHVLRLAEILAEGNAIPSANQKALLKKEAEGKAKI